jgi:two-component system NarL family sensor kinase
MSRRRTWLRRGAVVLGGLAVAEVLLAVALCPAAGFDWSTALSSFLVSNGLMGLSFALSGALIAWHRPFNLLGWLLMADGLGHATSALLAPLCQVLLDGGAPTPLLRVLADLFMIAWPLSITLFLPMAVLVFPDGRLPSPRWRPVAWAIVLTAPLFLLEMLSGTEPLLEGMPLGYLGIRDASGLGWLWTISEFRVLAALLVGVLALIVRYRRADETGRRQLLWLLLAAMVVLAAITPWSLVAGTPIVVLFSIPLIPLAICIAVVRHQLLDIRLVVSRAVAWLMLSVAALLAYVALVTLLESFVSDAVGRSALPAVLVAVALAPLLPRVQREVDRWMYGDRRDPARVAGRLGEHLAAGDERGLEGVVAALRSALRFPYVAIVDDDVVIAAAGEAPPQRARVPLSYAGEEVGQLEVGLRPGERRLSSADDAALGLVASPLAVALGALGLSADLQGSRERLVVAREEERRRLRRDLHDGLGPTLTGVALAADAATNFLDADPARTRELLGSLRRDTRTAIADVRRLVDDLRPPALDEIGLVGALDQRVGQLRWRSDGSALDVRLVAPDRLPALPAAVEVAAYRIATEALLNVTRHAGASAAQLRVSCADDRLEVVVTDDGPVRGQWAPGVGLEAMRERAAEVGGRFAAGPTPEGGRVTVSIPFGVVALDVDDIAVPVEAR